MKKILLLVVTIVLTSVLFAENVDQNKAKRIAKNFAAQRDRNAAQLKTDIVYSHPMPNKRDAAFYVVNLGETGFVIVSANDVAHPVLGYSFDKPWPTEGNLPSQVAGYLDDLANQIEYATEQTPDRGIKSEWQELLSINPNNPPQPKGNRTAVGPLLTTRWNQLQYYNSMCPENEYGVDGHVPTGCVATAMAQVVRYWEYPAHGRGQHSYQTFQNEYGTLAVNFEESYYDYDNMPDELTSESTPEEVNAVAKLIYDCGIANVLYYGVGGSSGYPGSPRTAFINHFGYSSNLGFADKNMYSPSEWIALLKSEINALAPVYCSGHDENVGHAFVFDGCNSDDFFHVNFGWSGDCDGWFLVSAINVQFYTWGDWQTALIGVRPGNNNNTLLCHTGSNPSSMNQEFYTVSEPMSLYSLSGKNEYLMNYWGSGGQIILHLTPSDNSAQLVLDVLRFDDDCSVAVYDGNNKDSLICVYETRYSNIPISYDFLPSDTLLQQKATTDLSPVVSTKHGLTVVSYSYGLINKEFHLRVSDASECRMVSNIVATPNETGYDLTWNENGTATQWQVAWDDNMVSCETTSLSIDELSHDAMHEVKIRSVCGGESYSEWMSIIINNNNIYWSDHVTSEPEGFVINNDTIFISSAEGLAWLSHLCEHYDYKTGNNSKTVLLNSDINLETYKWKPFRYYGRIVGNGHSIYNLHTDHRLGGSGLFNYFEGDTISDLHLVNARIYGDNGIGSLSGGAHHAVIMNCSSINYIVNDRYSQVGGLIGGASYSKIINCYAIGENYSGGSNGGLVGSNYYSEFINCYSSQGASFNWCSIDGSKNGLISGSVDEGIYDNCFADFENIDLHWNPEYDSIAKLYSFCGNINSVELIHNMAAFRVRGDTIGVIIQDTSINCSLGEMDVLTALNNKVIENNTSDLRTWVWDNNLHLPVLGNYYEPTCPGIKNLIARNIEINNGFAVALSWAEKGEAEEWQVKCVDENDNAVIHSSFSTNDTITGLILGKEYSFYVRPICGGEDTVGWGQPVELFVDKLFWSDVVTKRPEGYIVDGEGNVIITSAEGLAWFGKQGQSFEGKTIYIANDLDMGAYRWIPFYASGTIDGQNHTISNIICRQNINDENAWAIGFIGIVQNATVRNLTISDGIFSGQMSVGSMFGMMTGGRIDNCHVINTHVSGTDYIGGFGGNLSEGLVNNCSVTGYVNTDRNTGGLIGGCSSNGIVSNCYSNCNIQSLGKSPLHTRGGLAGYNAGHFINCYSAGVVDYDNTVYYNFTGTCFGNMNNPNIPEARFVYALHSDGVPILGRSDSWMIYPYILSDTASFNNSGVLNNSVTIGEILYTDLLSALNAWVDANNANGEYLHWVADTENQNGGFPMLEQEYQIQQLASGWNWYSTYIEQNDADGLSMLESGLGSHGELIMSRTGAMVENFEGSFWWGDLNAVTNEEMYEIKTNAQTNVVMTGSKATPSSHPITVTPGWNWIGYVSNTSNSIDNALSSLTSNEDDIIQSRNAFSSYFPGYGWYGDLENMTPGQGYMYKSNGTVSQTLVYPTASRSNESEAVAYHNQADYNRYRNVMDVMAKVIINGEPANSNRYELAAFVDGECRGRAKLQYVEPMDTYLAFITINGNDDETVTFNLYDEDMDVTYYASEANVVAFKANEVIGKFRAPYILCFNNAEYVDNAVFTVYPNPVANGNEITINFMEDVTEATLFVENELGLTVDVVKLSGKSAKVRLDLPSGLYILRVVIDGNIYYNKLIVK